VRALETQEYSNSSAVVEKRYVSIIGYLKSILVILTLWLSIKINEKKNFKAKLMIKLLVFDTDC